MFDDGDKTIFTCLGAILGFIGLIVIGSIMKGWAIATLWTWFIVPIFEFPALTVAQAIGVGLVVAMFTMQDVNADTKGKSATEIFAMAYGKVILIPVMLVAFGYVLRMFM